MNSIDKLREYPRTEQECYFKMPEPLISRDVLEPLFKQYVREHPAYETSPEYRYAQGFYEFLLRQAKEKI